MADITDQTSPTEDIDESQQGNGSANTESRGVKRQRAAPADDDDDDDDKGNRERRKIEIKFISDKSRRHITFSKRKAGIMKKVSSPARRITATPPHARRVGRPSRQQSHQRVLYRHLARSAFLVSN
jgi:MADS-box transcription factor